MASTKPASRNAKGRSGSSQGRKVSKKPSASRTKTQPKQPKNVTKEQKSRPIPKPVKKKRRIYTEKELQTPQLNKITPAGVQKPKGTKKGKVFVDDQVSLMTILAMVNAEKEGQIESKMMKAVS